jgi:hypothetical protein
MVRFSNLPKFLLPPSGMAYYDTNSKRRDMKQRKRLIEPVSVMAQDAVRIASGWLWDHLPDRFGPADPAFDDQEQQWRVPVVLAYPGIVIGQVGEIVIDAQSGQVVAHTDIEEIKALGLKLGRKHRAQVRAAFLRTRNA